MKIWSEEQKEYIKGWQRDNIKVYSFTVRNDDPLQGAIDNFRDKGGRLSPLVRELLEERFNLNEED